MVPASSSGLGLQRGDISRIAKVAVGTTGDIVADQIHGVVFRSQFSPEISLTGQQAVGAVPTPGGMGEMFMSITKPAVYVNTSLGTIRLAPWGEPTMNLYPVFLVGSIAAVGLGLGLLYRALKK